MESFEPLARTRVLVFLVASCAVVSSTNAGASKTGDALDRAPQAFRYCAIDAGPRLPDVKRRQKPKSSSTMARTTMLSRTTTLA
jgi:hypothetical protein